MYDHTFSEGRLIGSLSASDLRGLSTTEVDVLLALPVLKFLEARRSTKPYTCSAETSLLDVSPLLTHTKAFP